MHVLTRYPFQANDAMSCATGADTDN